MKRDANAPLLTAVFVDYDNIYLSLKRRNEEAARRFSKDASLWLKAIEQGRLISSDDGTIASAPRRIVLNRCYGNPVPRRNQADNSTDMNSFPFVRHHFLRAGFEIVDCPPLTSHQKNAADIRMVMDLRDYLNHATYFDEFIILSGDADFTPVLHRLRQHARRTIIYSNDHTAAAYAAICDGEVREADLIAALSTQAGTLAGPLSVSHSHSGSVMQTSDAAPVALQAQGDAVPTGRGQASSLRLDDLRQMVMAEVVAGIRAAAGPVPLEALADRAIRALGHERTVGTAWAGAGSFRELVRIALPGDLRMTEQPPFHAFDPQRHVAAPAAPVQSASTVAQQREALAAAMADLTQAEPEEASRPISAPAGEARPSRYAPLRPSAGPAPRPAPPAAVAPSATSVHATPPAALAPRQQAETVMHRSVATRGTLPAQAAPARADTTLNVQASLARIQDACQAPALSPSDYRIVFASMAQEISENGLTGAQTLTAVADRAQSQGLLLRREDVRFVLDVVSEPDPWFEQGASATLFAGRFRNFVVARCRDHGIQLSAGELDLIDSWIMATPLQPAVRTLTQEPPAARSAAPVQPVQKEQGGGRWWTADEPAAAGAAGADEEAVDDFPRIVRTRQRG